MDTTHMFDLTIIGAGPAGATLARLIGKRYRVLLIDKRSFTDVPKPFSISKCCGGLLAPDAQRMLSALGLGLPKRVLQGPQLFVVKALDVEQGLERYYQRHYINMDRRKFDAWLLSMVPSNVDIRTNCRFKRYSTENGFFKLKLLQGDRTYIEKTRILIGADGASSKVRSQVSPRSFLPNKYIAVQEWVESRDQLPYFISIFDRKITDFYSWAIPKGDFLLIGAALHPKRDTNAKFRLLKETLRNNSFQLGKTVWREGAHILRPMKTEQLMTGKDRIAFLGEAAGWISPSSAEGISYAFKSACALAEALNSSPEGFAKRYQKKTIRLKRNIFLKIMKSHFIFNPFLRKMVMKSGIQSVKPYQPKR